MQLVFEKPASVVKYGASLYLLLEEPFYTHLGLSKPTETGQLSGYDLKVAMGIGKHGKFVFVYSPSEQKKWKREQKKMEG